MEKTIDNTQARAEAWRQESPSQRCYRMEAGRNGANSAAVSELKQPGDVSNRTVTAFVGRAEAIQRSGPRTILYLPEGTPPIVLLAAALDRWMELHGRKEGAA